MFPRTVVRAGAGATAGVIELVVDADTGLLADAPHRPWLSGDEAPGRPAGRAGHRAAGPTTGPPRLRVDPVARAAPPGRSPTRRAPSAPTPSLSSYAVALGGGYARLRTDSALVGESGASSLRAAFIGRDDQMLDFRTLQDHRAPRTTSDLLFMGAVADTSHSVYSGLIRVRRGAVKSDAMQTNHNLVLDEGAHADSVPNLDIEENDVKCSHGSTVGPVDEDQRYYLESRGIEPERAEQLIVAGFFDSIADQVPLAGARDLIGRSLAERSGVSRG